jgi:hypothetical protein
MIGLFTKCSRGWFWELMFWLLIVELATGHRRIGDRGGYRDCCSRLFASVFQSIMLTSRRRAAAVSALRAAECSL